MKISIPSSVGGGYCIWSHGQSAKDIWAKSMARRLNAKLHSVNEVERSVYNDGSVCDRTFQFTFIGKRDKTGSFPIVGEFRKLFMQITL